jgi:hypothetical protein
VRYEIKKKARLRSQLEIDMDRKEMMIDGSSKALLAEYTPIWGDLGDIVASYAADADGHGRTRAAEVHPRQKK